jgi:uncharacterized protein (DUF983 family)
MPCYRCGGRQTDPARGASPWKRGVRRGAQVLICPSCQEGRDWRTELDRCVSCGSTMLVRVLGETRCRACGSVGIAITANDQPAAQSNIEASDLSAEVAAALDRLFAHRASADI